MSDEVMVREREAHAWLDVRDALRTYMQTWVNIEDDDAWMNFKEEVESMIDELTHEIYGEEA